MTIDDMDIQGYQPHKLEDKLEGHWAIDVSKVFDNHVAKRLGVAVSTVLSIV